MVATISTITPLTPATMVAMTVLATTTVTNSGVGRGRRRNGIGERPYCGVRERGGVPRQPLRVGEVLRGGAIGAVDGRGVPLWSGDGGASAVA